MQALSRNSDDDDDRGSFGNYLLQSFLVNIFQMVFSILGFVVVCWFSRWREFRADAGGAHLAGREKMISALKALKSVHEQGADQAGKPQPAFQAMRRIQLFECHNLK